MVNSHRMMFKKHVSFAGCDRILGSLTHWRSHMDGYRIERNRQQLWVGVPDCDWFASEFVWRGRHQSSAVLCPNIRESVYYEHYNQYTYNNNVNNRPADISKRQWNIRWMPVQSSFGCTIFLFYDHERVKESTVVDKGRLINGLACNLSNMRTKQYS